MRLFATGAASWVFNKALPDDLPIEAKMVTKAIERAQRTVEEKNSQLQSYAKIKKFLVLPADFTQEAGELTPTLKVKRKVVSEKHREAIAELYR